LGNHDQGAMFDPDGFNIGAERAIFWTRSQLESPTDRDQNERRWEFLGELPRSYRVGPFLFVHGSPRNPLSEYIFPEDIYNHRKMERLFQLVERYCFQGHTHVPGIFTESFQFFAPEEIDNEYTLGEGKLMVNVGSVGQPRDGDNRSCYVILEDGLGSEGDESPSAEASFQRTRQIDDESDGSSDSDPRFPIAPKPQSAPRITFRRLTYDFEKTIHKIYAIPDLEPFLGDRLRQGR
jgi:diadenosine tetraphosphatase ApaH/serine/threonine PP2A family protein phosphatase